MLPMRRSTYGFCHRLWGLFGMRAETGHSDYRPEKKTFWTRPSVCHSACKINTLRVRFGRPFSDTRHFHIAFGCLPVEYTTSQPTDFMPIAHCDRFLHVPRTFP